MQINHLIDGKTVTGREYFETVNPATQEVLAEVAAGGEAHLRIDLMGARDPAEAETSRQVRHGPLMGGMGIAVEQHHELLRLAAGFGRQHRTRKRRRHSAVPAVLRITAA